MILCPSCDTLNPEGESRCLACKAELAPSAGGSPTMVEDAGGQATARCPNGHPVDPAWSSCPYCDRRSVPGLGSSAATRVEDTSIPATGGGRNTRLETSGSDTERLTRLAGEEPSAATEEAAPSRSASPSVPPAPAGPPRGLRTTRLEEPALVRSPGRGTVLRASTPGTVRQPNSEAPARRLVAALAAPELRPGGAVFPVREGKNRIGADRNSEIRLDDDPQVSAEHALLLYRGGDFHLADRMSTNGTAINGQELTGTHSRVLRDRDRIRCGATELLFLSFDEATATPQDDGASNLDEPTDHI